MTIRYMSADEDSGRWTNFPFREGDIVISTRSKSGTTWMQMICALLIFQTENFPEPLPRLSPWLDRTTVPLQEILARLGAQTHRRLIKTHTPLDGIPIDRRATYIVVGRHPLDVAVSLYHQGNNIDRERLRQLTGSPKPTVAQPTRSDLHNWLLNWMNGDASPVDDMDGLRGVLWHITDAWRRRDQANVILVHYDDLLADLEGEMRRLADRLGVAVPACRLRELSAAATFTSMKDRVDEIAPNADGVLKDNRAFFRRGRSGAGTEVLSKAELQQYYGRAASIAPQPVFEWLHRLSAPGVRPAIGG
jgi:aryl sulfotransferase